MYLANELLKVAIEEIRAVGIEVPETIEPSVRIITGSRKWGNCRNVDGRFTISLNESLLTGDDMKSAMQTLAHEVLHTCDGCMNHGSLWKSYANRVNQRYGYNISRTNSASSLGVEVKSKYLVQCDDCGAKIRRDRMSKVVSNYDSYVCKCGGSLSRIY